jgi:hypothetical protein
MLKLANTFRKNTSVFNSALRSFAKKPAAEWNRDKISCSLTGKRGAEILHDPRINKGTAFNISERDRLGIRGLVPPRATDVVEQEYRVLRNYRKNTTDL